MSKQVSMQITEATQRQIDELTARGFGNRTDIVRLAIDRMHREEMTVKNEYLLDIYTWPAGQGVHADVRWSYHATPKNALAYLEAEERPYAHAVLQRQNGRGFAPCDWEGHFINDGEEWPHRYGTNGQHPDAIKLYADRAWMVAEIRRIHSRNGGAMIDIAATLLKERHPNVCGWEHSLAWEAAGESSS